MAGEEKVYIKENLMKLVASGTKPILQEQNHIKDALAKIIVELIKVSQTASTAYLHQNNKELYRYI